MYAYEQKTHGNKIKEKYLKLILKRKVEIHVFMLVE